MLHSMRTTSLAVALILFSSGCGGGSSSSQSSPQTGSLDFKTSGTYDLSQYIVPAQNQLNTFIERTYKDTDGNQIYGTTPTKTSEVVQRYEVDNNSIKEYDEKGNLDTTYTITQTAITQLLSNTDSIQIDNTTKIVRYADRGDPVANTILNIPIETFGSDAAMTLTCTLQNHVDSKQINTQTFDDVITIACQGFVDTDITYQDIPLTLTMTLAIHSYYSNSIGEIGSIEETCYTINSMQTVQQCTKTVSEIASIL